MRTIYVVTGGTLVHVSPHFSLCAPAYGAVGAELGTHLQTSIARLSRVSSIEVIVVRTRLAGPNDVHSRSRLAELGLSSAPETNQDLRDLVHATLTRADTAALVMAAAVCDFEPDRLTSRSESGEETRLRFGKDQTRLHGVSSLTLDLVPSAKIIDDVKAQRPDVCLATFKTTAGVPLETMLAQATANLLRSRSDFVFANDMHHHANLVVTKSSDVLQGQDRTETLKLLCEALIQQLVATRP